MNRGISLETSNLKEAEARHRQKKLGERGRVQTNRVSKFLPKFHSVLLSSSYRVFGFGPHELKKLIFFMKAFS